jgi:pimeloyl-ACP methyl ester carboxylesterase
MERRELSVGSGRVSYLRADGEPAGRPVVFVHGLTIEARSWLPIVDQVGARRWFALDLPGHGASGWRDEYSFRGDAEALLLLLTEIGEPAVAVGHSRGAQVCLLAAAMRPDMFLAMYLEDLTPRFWWEARERGLVFVGSVLRLRGIAETARTEGRDAAWLAERMGELKHDSVTTFGNRLTLADLRVWAEAVLNFDGEMLGTKGLFAPPAQSAAEILTSIEGPIHLAHGEEAHGSGVTGEELAWFHATARQPTSTLFPGLGHFLHGARPTQFAEDLRTFLARVG